MGWWLYYMVAVLAVLLAALYLYFTRNFAFWKKRGIPYVKPQAFFGNLKDIVLMKVDIATRLKQIYDDYPDKPFVGMFSFDRPALLVRDLDLAKLILVKDSNVFLNRVANVDEDLDPMFGRTLFTLKGKRWKHLRTNLTPVFTSGKMKRMFSLVENCSKELSDVLAELAQSGDPVAVKDTVAKFTTDVISSCAFGIESNSLRNPDAEIRRGLRKIFEFDPIKALAGVTFFFAPAIQNFLRIRVIEKETAEFVRKTVWSTVKYREQHHLVRKDFLDSMMDLRRKTMNEEADRKIDGDDFVAQAFAFFAAGFETSATTMTFALYLLSWNPDKQKILRDEIRQVLERHDQEVTYDAVQEMTYLDMVVSETMRLFPPLGFLDRITGSPYKLETEHNLTLPAGIGVYIPVLGIHLDPEIFPEPENFIPERFSPENKSTRHNFAYLPFGEGPRNCIGMRFGLMQAKTGLLHILRRFEVARCNDTPREIKFDPKNFLLSHISEIPLVFREAPVI